MINKEKVTAIILTAGNSTRYGQNRNKNFEIIWEKTVLYYSIKAFDINSYVDNIIIATKEDDIQTVKSIIVSDKFNKNIDIIIGGNTRKESVYNSINNTDSEIVIIHDGARPVLKQEYINKCIKSMTDFKGVTIGVKTKDTIKITDRDDIVITTTKRSSTWSIQTPQCFKRKILLKAHEQYGDEEITDDCMLLERNKHKVKVIEGDYTNIKITTREDLNIAKEFIKNFKKDIDI